MRLAPDDVVTAQDLARGERMLVRDAAWATLAGALSGGVILSAFALELGARPAQMGLLAAIPFLLQAAQLPAIALVERVRQRRKIGVLAITAARVLILVQALLPLFAPTSALSLLLAVQVAICALVAVGSCAVNGWLHQLIPHERLGAFFSRRLFWGTAIACVGTLAAGWWVEYVPRDERLRSFALSFGLAAVAGFISSHYLARAPEPRMHDAGPAASTWSRLRAPLADENFRRALLFLGAWNVACNVAAPFLTVYLIRQLGYPLTTVTSLWVSGQVANALTLYLWGRLTDRFTNKAVLAVALPLYFVCTVGLVFCAGVDDPRMQLGLLFLVHVVMGAAAGGISLASGNLGLKLAAPGQATAYLATIGLVSAVAGGIAPMAGGALAQWFQDLSLAFVMRWEAQGVGGEATMLAFAHWEFIFAISAALGLYVLHALSRVREGVEVSERVVMQQFAVEALRSVTQLSSVGGVLGGLFPFERLAERRRLGRRAMR